MCSKCHNPSHFLFGTNYPAAPRPRYPITQLPNQRAGIAHIRTESHPTCGYHAFALDQD